MGRQIVEGFMLGLAYRQLRLDPGRSVLTCIGIGAVFAVILLLQGFQQGLDTQLRSVALERGADLIATQAGVSNMVGARSVIPQMARSQVEAVAGVRAAYPMTAIPLIYEKDDRKSAVFLFVIDSLGGPTEIMAGRDLRGEGEIVIDRSVAQLYELAPGDEFVIAGYPFEIVGVTEPQSAIWTPFTFSNYDSLIEFYFEADLADDLSAFPLLSYLLIQVQENVAPSLIAAGVEEAVPDVDVFTPARLAEGDEALGKTMLGAVLTLLIIVAYGAGLLVVALFMFTSAEARRRDLGILKALGFANRTILISIVAEVAMLMVLAVPLGVLLAHLTTVAVSALMPIYLIRPTVLGPTILAVAGCALFAVLGALVPLRMIRRLEPAEVFRS